MEQSRPETWLPVAGHPGYQVSDLGRVRSVDRWVAYPNGKGRHQRGRLLRSRPANGYLQVDVGGVTRLVHRLVLAAFVGPCPPGLECLHGPGGRQDNSVANLRWGSRSENLGLTVTATAQCAGPSSTPQG